MATNSIFHDIELEDENAILRLIEACEKAEAIAENKKKENE